MDQKLPIFIGAMALLVVAAIWWQMQGNPAAEIPSVEVTSGSSGAPSPSKQRGASMRENLRGKRDAWLAAREKREVGSDTQDHPSTRSRLAGQTSKSADERASAETPPRIEHTPARRIIKTSQSEIDELKNIALTDPDPDERISALWSLSISDEAQALPVLTSALRDADREVRLAAVQELGGLEEESAVVDALAIAIGDSDPEIREEVVRVIGDTEDPRAGELARRLLNDPVSSVREEAESVLDMLDEED